MQISGYNDATGLAGLDSRAKELVRDLVGFKKQARSVVSGGVDGASGRGEMHVPDTPKIASTGEIEGKRKKIRSKRNKIYKGVLVFV